jgi:hypothetical protein
LDIYDHSLIRVPFEIEEMELQHTVGMARRATGRRDADNLQVRPPEHRFFDMLGAEQIVPLLALVMLNIKKCLHQSENCSNTA